MCEVEVTPTVFKVACEVEVTPTVFKVACDVEVIPTLCKSLTNGSNSTSEIFPVMHSVMITYGARDSMSVLRSNSYLLRRHRLYG